MKQLISSLNRIDIMEGYQVTDGKGTRIIKNRAEIQRTILKEVNAEFV